MGVEEFFWKHLKEFGSLNCIEFAYRGVEYKVVGNYGDRVFEIYTVDRDGPGNTVGEFASIEELLDDSVVADGLSLRQIFQRIQPRDFLWL